MFGVSSLFYIFLKAVQSKRAVFASVITAFLLTFLCSATARLSFFQHNTLFFENCIIPCCLYLFLVVIVAILFCDETNSGEIQKNFSLVMRYSWWIIPLKLSWNLINIVIMGVECNPDETATLFPIFFLFMLFLLMVLTAGFFIPRALRVKKNYFDMGALVRYVIFATGKLFFCLIGFLFISLLFLIIIATVFSYFHEYFSKFFFQILPTEEVINIIVYVFFYHMMGATFFVLYHAFHEEEHEYRPKRR